MVTVYRLETVDGCGVYNSAASSYISFDGQRHPLPQMDSLLTQNLSYHNIEFKGYGNVSLHFGFSSIEQLRFWFYNDAELIAISNYIVLSIYEAEEVYVGNSQVCFNRSTAELKVQHDLVEFFNL